LTRGTLASTETGTDSFSGTSSAPSARTGTLQATETGTDTATIVARNIVRGSLAVSETGTDTAALTAKLVTRGSLSVSETGTDTSNSTGKVIVKGLLSRSEDPDTTAISGKVLVRASLSGSEGPDTATLVGKVLVRGTTGLQEIGFDSAQGIAKLRVLGTLGSTESGSDVGFVDGKLVVRANSSSVFELLQQSVAKAKISAYSSYVIPLTGQATAIKITVSVRKSESFITSEEISLFLTTLDTGVPITDSDPDYLYVTEAGPVYN
jgi:hypothetical protein